jgi:hypothetical protein
VKAALRGFLGTAGFLAAGLAVVVVAWGIGAQIAHWLGGDYLELLLVLLFGLAAPIGAWLGVGRILRARGASVAVRRRATIGFWTAAVLGLLWLLPWVILGFFYRGVEM